MRTNYEFVPTNKQRSAPEREGEKRGRRDRFKRLIKNQSI